MSLFTPTVIGKTYRDVFKIPTKIAILYGGKDALNDPIHYSEWKGYGWVGTYADVSGRKFDNAGRPLPYREARMGAECLIFRMLDGRYLCEFAIDVAAGTYQWRILWSAGRVTDEPTPWMSPDQWWDGVAQKVRS